MEPSTICALSSAPGSGAIALIRLSGPEAVSIVDAVFISKKHDNPLQKQKSHTVHFGEIKEGEWMIDEVLVSVFKAPNTYTGEDIIEISCHGSVFIQQQLLQLFIRKGARMAGPGEFTQRAYLNGKLDLSQAEAVADLIASGGSEAHRIALNQMRGGVSNELKQLRNELLRFISLIELELDFSEEDVEFADRTQLTALLQRIGQMISRLVHSFSYGNAIKNGIPVAIVGEPNVGKSTLLNALLNDEKAIVSDIAGTTRDSIEDTFVIEGITFRFIDTAGLRQTTDTIESLGIERTYRKIEQASIVLLLVDATDKSINVTKAIDSISQRGLEEKKLILVYNKSDLVSHFQPNITHPALFGQVAISARGLQQLPALVQLISEAARVDKPNQNDVIVSNARHYDALVQAQEALTRAEQGLQNKLSTDFLAMDIREVIHHLAGITGEEITTDEVLGNIFKNFCIGK